MSKDYTFKYDVNGEEIILTPKMCQDFLVSGMGSITLKEYKFFTTLCRNMKLNPFAKDCYIMKYSNDKPATIVTSKDVIFRRAMAHPDFDGLENGVIVQNTHGEIEERKGGFVLPKEELLVGAWAKAYRKNVKCPYYVSISLDEVIQKKSDGKANKMWATKPAMMSIKVASVRALREMFTEELQGLYVVDEMDNVIKPDDFKSEEIEQTDSSIQVENIKQPEVKEIDDKT